MIVQMLTLAVASVATTLSACAVKSSDQAPASAPSATPGERKGDEQIDRSPTQPPAEIDPPHQDPGTRVPPPPPGKASTPSS